MKLQIIKSQDELIEGYEAALVSPNGVMVGHISDNECEVILAHNVIEQYKIKKAGMVLKEVLDKLRLNGTIKITGVDMNCLFHGFLNGLVKKESVCEVMQNHLCILEVNDIIDTLKSFGLEIDYYKLTGVNYEVSATRK